MYTAIQLHPNVKNEIGFDDIERVNSLDSGFKLQTEWFYNMHEILESYDFINCVHVLLFLWLYRVCPNTRIAQTDVYKQKCPLLKETLYYKQ